MNYRHYYCSPKYSEKEKSYFGTVKDLPGARPIEAETIEEFEELFHQVVDDALEVIEKKKAKRKTIGIVSFFAVATLLVVMAVTCPNKAKHTAAVSELASVILNDAASGAETGFAILGAMIGNKFIGAFIENNLYIDNYLLFNVGKFEYNGESNVVSVGAFNHVFTMSRDQLRKKVKEDDTLNKALNGLF